MNNEPVKTSRGFYPEASGELFEKASQWVSEEYSYVPFMEPARNGFIAGANHVLAQPNQEYHPLTNPWRNKCGQLTDKNNELQKERDELMIVVKKCADDYWFMTNLIEKYSSFDKEETIKDVLERMKFRKPMFNIIDRIKGLCRE